MGSLSTFNAHHWITASEYDEHGPGVGIEDNKRRNGVYSIVAVPAPPARALEKVFGKNAMGIALARKTKAGVLALATVVIEKLGESSPAMRMAWDINLVQHIAQLLMEDDAIVLLVFG